MTRKTIQTHLPDTFLLLPEFDPALVGILIVGGYDLALYSQAKTLAILERELDAESAFAVLEQTFLPLASVAFLDDISFEGA